MDDEWKQADPRLALAVTETWKSIDFQREQATEMRTRTGAALTLASIAFAFVNQVVIPEGHMRAWAWPPLIGIGILFGAVLYVVVPRSWAFVRWPGSLSWYWENSKTHNELLSSLYDDGVRDYKSNGETLRKLEIAHLLAVIVLGLVLGSLVLAVVFTD